MAPVTPAPVGLAMGGDAEDVAMKSIPMPSPPARPCPLNGSGWVVRFAGVALRFEVQGGKPIAVTCADEEASRFGVMVQALQVARDVFGPDVPDQNITVTPIP